MSLADEADAKTATIPPVSADTQREQLVMPSNPIQRSLNTSKSQNSPNQAADVGSVHQDTGRRMKPVKDMNLMEIYKELSSKTLSLSRLEELETRLVQRYIASFYSSNIEKQL